VSALQKCNVSEAIVFMASFGGWWLSYEQMWMKRDEVEANPIDDRKEPA
jgi:hypothetical protein